MRWWLSKFQELICKFSGTDILRRESEATRMLIAKSLIRDIRSRCTVENIRDAEFKVFSQFGDDGIIQYLIHNVDIPCKSFIEFGVENYMESNTRFLLMNDNWRGLIIDGSKEAVDYIRNDEIYWRHDLTAVNHFITRDNINTIFSENGFSEEIGILSIDIDGNDYWIWDSIVMVDPVIVIVEYNSVFGAGRAVTVPYVDDFQRTKAHYSNLYWGCSLKALCLLSSKKEYAFVGCNSSGNNAYFVRKDRMSNLRSLTAEDGFVESRLRESRDAYGRLTFAAGPERLTIIEGMPVIDVENDKQIMIKNLREE